MEDTHMTKAVNTYSFEDKRAAPKMQGKGPRPRTLLLAQAQAGQTRAEFVELVTDFMGVKAVQTTKEVTPKQAPAKAPAKAKTDTRTAAIDAAIFSHAEKVGKAPNHFRNGRKAAIAGMDALDTYAGTLTGLTSIRGQLVPILRDVIS